jgi:hypothetical protein
MLIIFNPIPMLIISNLERFRSDNCSRSPEVVRYVHEKSLP